jgi:hypothetical protein
VLKNMGHATVRPLGFELLFLPEVLAFSTAGALVAWRRPRMPAGWLLLAVGLVWTMVGALTVYVDQALVSGLGGRPGGAFAAWLLNWVWILAFVALGLFFLLFPDGQLPGRGWQVVLWANIGGSALVLIARVFMPPHLIALEVASCSVGSGGRAGIRIPASAWSRSDRSSTPPAAPRNLRRLKGGFVTPAPWVPVWRSMPPPGRLRRRR